MNMQSFWQDLGASARTAVIAALLGAAALLAGAAYWWLAPDFQVLFSELTPQDAAAMAQELDKMKVPYRVGDDGTSLLVDRDQVYRTRMKLMGRDVPVHGAVGFELFNNSDFGMTEFAQKINYQRALQGELTRTILSLAQVRDARVLLVLPEQSLFKQAAAKPKASVTLTMRPGETLRPDQVAGIQRLVAASVSAMQTDEVTILDHSGVTLSRNNAGEEGDAGGSGRLDLKKETENYLARKAGEVLERSFGPGRAMATVDVVLNADRAQVTTEDLVVPPSRAGQALTGVVVRERETVRDPAAADKQGDAGAGTRAGSSQREVEYAVGRRVEQVVSQPGGIRRLQAVAVIREHLDAEQQEQIRRVLAAAVGASFERGDTVVVHALGVAAPGKPAGQQAQPMERLPRSGVAAAGEEGARWMITAAAALVALGLAFIAWQRRRGLVPSRVYTPAALTDAQRQASVAKVEAWLAVEGEARVGERA